jgi:DNA-binding response OmpR family regulator
MTRILVVDGDVGIQELLKGYLEKEGYDVKCASTGEEGLEQMDKRVAVVLLAIMLPDMHGLDVLNRIRETSPSTPVIIVTGLAEDTVGLESMKRGAVDFVTKPIDLQHLYYVIQFHVLRGASAADA